MKPTPIDVLRAVDTAISPWSCYIHDEIQTWHRQNVAKGIKGHPPTMALVLKRLKLLQADGLLTRSTLRKGAYGYRWTITDRGRFVLSVAEARDNAHRIQDGLRKVGETLAEAGRMIRDRLS